MNLFKIDFLAKMSTLLKEAFKFKKYKAMHPALAVFVGLLMIPVVAASFVAVAVLASLGFVLAVISSPIKYLHSIVNEEGKQVKHATQAFIYIISWPLVFMLYAVVSLLLVLIMPAYALTAFLTYVWTLGGFKFHLFVSEDDDISIEVKGRYLALPIVYVCIGAVAILVIPFIHGLVHYMDLYKYYLEGTFVQSFFGGIYPIYQLIFNVFSLLYTLIGFVRFPKVKTAKAVQTDDVARDLDVAEPVAVANVAEETDV